MKDINDDIILHLANKYGIKIDSSKVFGSVESINLRKGEEIRYRYEGATPQRRFCRELIRIDKFYTKEEIDVMSFSGRNKKFGHNGQSYSIWKYKGGVNCKHKWVSYTVLRERNGSIKQTAKINDVPGLPGEIANSSNNFHRF